VPTALINEELAQMHTCVITTTCNRSVLGSMNDHTFAAQFFLGQSPSISIVELHRYLAEVPLKAIDYRYPRDVALDLLSGTNSTV